MMSSDGVKEYNVLIAGVGGQGNILSAYLIARAALMEGLKIRVGEVFGMSQRGGPVVSHVRMGAEIYSSTIPLEKGNLIIGLEPVETLRVAARYAAPDSYIFFNTVPVFPVSVNIGQCEYPKTDDITHLLCQMGKKIVGIDALSLAKKAGEPKTLNVVMVGFSVASGVVPIRLQTFRKALREVVPGRLLDVNIKAFELGIEASCDLKENNMH